MLITREMGRNGKKEKRAKEEGGKDCRKEGREEDQVSRKHPESGASKKSKPVS